jgi:hypothetical protein
MKRALVAVLGLGLLSALGVGPANADPVTIAGITVDSLNFANALLSNSPAVFSTEGGPLATSVTDLSANTWAFSNTNPPTYLQLGFTNLVNGPGNDLVVWEIGTPDNFGMSLTIGGPTHTIVSASTGFTNAQSFGINTAFLNLDDLGVASGAAVTSLVFNMGLPFANTASSPTLGAAAALAPVPEPTTLALVGTALAVVGTVAVVRRRNKHNGTRDTISRQ